MVEHYRPEVIERTASLYTQVLEWAKTRDDVTIVGGWAVYHHVKKEHAMQSRDVDIVLHTRQALHGIVGNLDEWDLTFRLKGRKRFPDAHFRDEDPMIFRLDLFTAQTNTDWIQRFGRHGHRNIKEAPRSLFPPLDWILQDKLRTIPLRERPDPADKRAKDLIDVYNLVFNNKEDRSAQGLLQITDGDARKKVRPHLEDAVVTRPEYREAMETLAQWLQ